MTNTKRWIDELPLESHERELLLVGKAARPAEGAIDANWQALCVALGTTAAGSAVVSSVATNSISASAKVGSSLVASKAAGAGLLVVAAKSLAVGVAVGLAVMGAGSVAEHLGASDERPATQSQRVQAPTARRPAAQPIATSIVAHPIPDPVALASSLPGTIASSSPPRERGVANNPTLTQPGTPAPAISAMSAEDKTASLSRQARELAELKRLIDNGATSEALRRLDKNFSADATSVLSEERDALYVQALARAQRRNEARAFARRFLLRYPHSPYFETMRQLLAEE